MRKLIARMLAVSLVSLFAFVAVPASAQSGRSGFYAGINAGTSKGDVIQTVSGFGMEETDKTSTKGQLFGVQAGYKHQFDNKVVVGLETDIQRLNVTGIRTLGDATSGTLRTTTELSWLGTTRLNLGYAFDKFRPYITGGLAYGSVTTDNNLADSLSVRVTQGAIGYVLGGGVEYAVSRNWAVRGEYLHMNMTISKNEAALFGETLSDKTSLKSNIVRFGVNYYF